MEILFEILFEVFLQFGGELLFDALGRAMKQPFSKRYAAHPLAAILAYALVGGIFGGLSLLLFPEAFLRDPRLRIAYVAVSPFLAGLLMHWVGSMLERRDRGRTKLETFAAGFAFALAFSVVRALASR